MLETVANAIRLMILSLETKSDHLREAALIRGLIDTSARGGFLDKLIRTEPFDSVLTSDGLRGEIQSQWERAKQADFTETELLESLVGEFRNGRLNHRVAVEKNRLVYSLASNSVPVPLKSNSKDIYLGKHPCLGYIFRITFEPADVGVVNGYRFETIDGYAMDFARSSAGVN